MHSRNLARCTVLLAGPLALVDRSTPFMLRAKSRAAGGECLNTDTGSRVRAAAIGLLWKDISSGKAAAHWMNLCREKAAIR